MDLGRQALYSICNQFHLHPAGAREGLHIPNMVSTVHGVDSAARFAYPKLRWRAFTHTFHSPTLPSLRIGVVRYSTGTQRFGEPSGSSHRWTCARLKALPQTPRAIISHARCGSVANAMLPCNSTSHLSKNESMGGLRTLTRDSHIATAPIDTTRTITKAYSNSTHAVRMLRTHQNASMLGGRSAVRQYCLSHNVTHRDPIMAAETSAVAPASGPTADLPCNR